MLVQPFAVAAKKALSLKKDNIFKLLVVMTALLGFVAGVAAGGTAVMQNIYASWQLQKQSELSVYLPAGAEEAQLQDLTLNLAKTRGVEKVARIPQEEIQTLVSEYLAAGENFPLPTVLEVRVNQTLVRQNFDEKIKQAFPAAEIDDAREVLTSVAQMVRLVQTTAVVLAVIVLGIMVMLVSLTVRAGLRSQRQSIHILSYVGATDGFLNALIVHQVLVRSLVGWAVAAVLAVAALAAVFMLVPAWQAYFNAFVWAAAVATPLALTLISAFVAWLTASHVVQREA